MSTHSVAEARNRLSQLIHRALEGEEIVITRQGRPVVEARSGCSAFDTWTAQATLREETMTADIRAAEAFLRRLDLSLRTADALNIAIAQRLRAELVTFDRRMEASARLLGIAVVAA